MAPALNKLSGGSLMRGRCGRSHSPSLLLFTRLLSSGCSFWCRSDVSWLSSDWQEELELWWELILGVESVGEIDSSNSAVGVDLNSEQTSFIN